MATNRSSNPLWDEPVAEFVWRYATQKNSPNYNSSFWAHMAVDQCLQDGGPKIAKLVYKWFNYGLW